MNKAPESMKSENFFHLNGTIEFYAENGAFIQKESCSFDVMFDIAERNQNQSTQHDLHQQALEVIREVQAATVSAIKDISAASANALHAVATPLSDVSKALVKMAEDSRASTAENAKQTQHLLIKSLTNRIIEGDQTRAKPTSLTDDIKEIMTLLPAFQGFLGMSNPDSAPQTELPSLIPPASKPKNSA